MNKKGLTKLQQAHLNQSQCIIVFLGFILGVSALPAQDRLAQYEAQIKWYQQKIIRNSLSKSALACSSNTSNTADKKSASSLNNKTTASQNPWLIENPWQTPSQNHTVKPLKPPMTTSHSAQPKNATVPQNIFIPQLIPASKHNQYTSIKK